VCSKIITRGIDSDHCSDFNKSTGIQIKFLYEFMPCILYMIHYITVKGEGSLAVRTNPNIVQIFRVHIFCLVVNNHKFDLSIGRSSYGANHYKRRHFLL
jgi:hypothetical protein